MARKSYTDLIAQNIADLPDNNTGDISPADVRNMIGDFLDTTQPGYGVYGIDTSGGAPSQLFSATPSIVTLWNTSPIFTPEFSSDVSGGIVINQPCVVRVTGSLSIEFGNGAQMDFFIQDDEPGSLASYEASVQGRGSGKPVGINITGLFDIQSAGTTISMSGAAESGSETVTALAGAFICEYVPLINNPVP